MSALFDIRWTPSDLLRTLFDRSVLHGGFLGVQDDLELGPPPEPEIILPAALPYHELVTAVPALTDHRQTTRAPAKKRGRAHGTRDISKVTAIWLHQTAAMLATPDRFLSVPAHGGVTTRGEIVLLHPFRAYMYHGHTANSFTIGIEVACRAAGIEGDPRTLWRSKREKNGYKTKSGRFIAPKSYLDLVHEATDAQLFATQALIGYYINEVERQGGRIRAIGGHRQSHSSRISDPGSRLWQECGEWAVREFGIKRGPVVGSGNPLATIWTGEGSVPYSGRVRGL